MDAATLAAICMVHAQNPAAYPAPAAARGCIAPAPRPAGASGAVPGDRLARLRPIVTTPDARDAMARTVVAEAGNQGDSGMAGVVYAILNRLGDGAWGATVQIVVDAPGQFEAVMRAGGSWRGLRPVTPAQEARVNTIVNLALDGRLPDLTHGARYFQNPQVVAARAQAGRIAGSLVNFGGSPPSAIIGDHAFYVVRAARPGGPRSNRAGAPKATAGANPGAIFVGENRVGEALQVAPAIERAAAGGRAAVHDGNGIFVGD